MSEKARKVLAVTEKEARLQVLREFQALQIRLKQRFASLLTAIEEQRKLTGSVPVSFLYERSRLATLLVDVANEIKAMTPNLANSIANAQKQAVDLSDNEFNQLLQTQSNAGQIVRFNPEAARQLIGNTQNQTPLQTFLDKIPAPLVQSLKNVLIDGVANGFGSSQIASEINQVLGTGTAHALTIARTEMNQAFRQANLIHYKNNSDIVKGYVWLSALDLRTCLICWSRHGVVFKLNKKPNSHPNCRCTMVTFLPGNPIIETGEQKFKKLTDQQKIAILGKQRFDQYEQGLKLSDFVGEQKTIYGQTPYIKKLADLPIKSIPKKPTKTVVPSTKKAVKITKPVTSGKPLTSKQASSKLKAIDKKYKNKQSELADKLLEAREGFSKLSKNAEIRKMARIEGVDVSNKADFIAFRKEKASIAIKQIQTTQMELDGLMEKLRSEALEVVKVEKPTNLKIKFGSKFTKEEQSTIQTGVDEFNSLIDESFLKNQTFVYKKDKANRSYYTNKTIHLSKKARTESGRSTIIHESAHGLEMIHSDILDQALEFWEYRTKGEKLVKLSKVTGIKSYGNLELCKVDQFKNPYDGKEPYTITKYDIVKKAYVKKPVATEIITRGMEYLSQNPANFAVEQPEYFDFIYTILRGGKWQPK